MAETELDRFFRENRIREAQSVEPSVFEDPRYASMIYNSSVPLNQLQKNIQQSQGATLEPYKPTMRENIKYGIRDLLTYLGTPEGTASNVARGFMGNPNAEAFSKSVGLLDVAPIVNIPFYLQEAGRGFQRAQKGTDYIAPAIEGGAAILEGALVTKPLAKKLKGFSKSLSQKLQGETDVSAPTIGSLPKAEPKMLASTRRMPPGGGNVMTNPRKLDDFGFFYKSEEVANKMKQNKGSGKDFENYFLKQGVTKSELFDTGLDELFKVTSRPITKKDILTKINVNKLELYEDVYQDNPVAEGSSLIFENIADKISETPSYNKFSNYEIDEIRLNHLNKGIKVSDETRAETELVKPTKVLEDTKTGYRIVYDDDGQNFLTFDKDADIFDITQSEQYKGFRDSGDDMDAYRFNEIAERGNINEAIVQTESYAIQNGDYVAKDARFSRQTQPGGTNYREFVIGKQSNNPTLAQRGEYDLVDDYQNPIHFPNYNPIVHLRTKDRTLEDGSKTLYVEEFQSDRGQAGRQRGFAPGSRSYAKLEEEMKGYNNELLNTFKNIPIKLKSYEQEELYKRANPDKPIIRVPFRSDLSPSELKLATDQANMLSDDRLLGTSIQRLRTDLEEFLDVDNSRIPEEFKTMKLSDYLDFISDPDYKGSSDIEMFNLMRIIDSDRRYPLGRDDLDGFPPKFNEMSEEQQINRLRSALQDIQYERYDIKGSNRFPDLDTFAGYADQLRNDIVETNNKMMGNVPGGDLVESTEDWTKFGIKRLLQRAVLEGHDSVSFSPGQVQVDRWGNEGLLDHYEDKIPSMAKKVAGKENVSKQIVEIRPTNLHTVVMLRGSSPLDRVYQVKEVGTDLPVASFKTLEEAQNNADFRNATQKQESVTIKITPELREKVLKGLSLFTMGAGTAIGLDEQLGALSNMPSTQANAT
jgi:hypothetical protein